MTNSSQLLGGLRRRAAGRGGQGGSYDAPAREASTRSGPKRLGLAALKKCDCALAAAAQPACAGSPLNRGVSLNDLSAAHWGAAERRLHASLDRNQQGAHGGSATASSSASACRATGAVGACAAGTGQAEEAPRSLQKQTRQRSAPRPRRRGDVERAGRRRACAPKGEGAAASVTADFASRLLASSSPTRPGPTRSQHRTFPLPNPVECPTRLRGQCPKRSRWQRSRGRGRGHHVGQCHRPPLARPADGRHGPAAVLGAKSQQISRGTHPHARTLTRA